MSTDLKEVQNNPLSQALLFDFDKMAAMQQFAEIMASGRSTIPDHLRGNVGDCMAITMQASQWGMNPYSVASKTHIIGGKLGFEAQLVNSVVIAMAPTKDRLHYEWFGDWSKILGKFKTVQGKKGAYQTAAWNPADEADLGVKVWATLKGENEPRVLTLLLTQATVRNSTLWTSDPKQQLAYLASKRWARLFCPDTLLGVYTPDELERPTERDITPVASVVPEKPASSRTEGMLNKLKPQTDKAPEAPHIIDQPPATQEATEEERAQTIINLIEAAQDQDELNELAGCADELPDELKPEVRHAYANRIRTLKAERSA